MRHFDAYIEKKYGHYLIKDILLTMIFVMVFIVVLALLKPYWDTGEDTILAKVGTITSITGVFLGTYIALWLIIQSKTKKIEENFFYKISFLTNVQGMLHPIQQMSFNIKVEKKFGSKDVEKIQNMRKSLYEEFEYWKNQLEKINSNTSVPADIRTRVDMLIHQGIKPISFANQDLKLQKKMVEKTLLNPLNSLIDSKYFTDDKDSQVKHYLKQVMEWRDRIIDSVTSD